jgi:hypothetical protein
MAFMALSIFRNRYRDVDSFVVPGTSTTTSRGKFPSSRTAKNGRRRPLRVWQIVRFAFFWENILFLLQTPWNCNYSCRFSGECLKGDGVLSLSKKMWNWVWNVSRIVNVYNSWAIPWSGIFFCHHSSESIVNGVNQYRSFGNNLVRIILLWLSCPWKCWCNCWIFPRAIVTVRVFIQNTIITYPASYNFTWWN